MDMRSQQRAESLSMNGPLEEILTIGLNPKDSTQKDSWITQLISMEEILNHPFWWWKDDMSW